MPHFHIYYSPNLDEDTANILPMLADTVAETGIYPLGGTRIRAFKTDHIYLADNHEANACFDMVIRMGEGRTIEQKKSAGERIMKTATDFFADKLETGHLIVSLAISEIDSNFSWKKNSIYKRLPEKT